MPEKVRNGFSVAKQNPSYTQGVPWYQHRKIFVPINIHDKFHWICAVIDLQQMTITCYDSLEVSLLRACATATYLLTHACFWPCLLCSLAVAAAC